MNGIPLPLTEEGIERFIVAAMEKIDTDMICLVCGCTDFEACVVGPRSLPCRWIDPYLCSACASPFPREP
jgi:hypothetical protein